MAILNEKNENTVKNIHLMVTSLCNKDCPHCCNKQYDLGTIPQVTDEELRSAENIFITGGEPFVYSRPDEIAECLKKRYPNIKKAIVYSGIFEAWEYLVFGGSTEYIDGLTLSIKEHKDIYDFESVQILLKNDPNCKSNRLYCFDERDYEELTELDQIDTDGFEVSWRAWQTDFVPAPDSIFRRI